MRESDGQRKAGQLSVALAAAMGLAGSLLIFSAATSLAASRAQPDLILMDVQLPGQDGMSLTRELKSDPHTARIPVVALTAHAMAGDRERAIEAGCEGYVTKPIDTRMFGEQVRKFLADSRQAAAS